MRYYKCYCNIAAIDRIQHNIQNTKHAKTKHMHRIQFQINKLIVVLLVLFYGKNMTVYTAQLSVFLTRVRVLYV